VAITGEQALRSPVRTRSPDGGKTALPAESAIRLAMAASRPLRAEMMAEDIVGSLSDLACR
jgi:hypothetical protein